MNRLMLLLALLSCVAVSLAAQTDDVNKPVVYFRGISFAGTGATILTRFPYVTAIDGFRGSSTSKVNEELHSLFAQKSPRTFVLSSDLIDDNDLHSKDQVIDLTLLIDKENVLQTTYQVEGVNYYKILAQIRAQAFYFDVTKNAMVLDRPISFSYIDVLTHAPSHAEIQQRVQTALIGNENVTGLAHKFVDSVISTSFPKDTSPNLIGINKVDISSKAATAFGIQPDNTNALNDLKNRVASTFAESMSSENNVSFLPYSGDGYLLGKTIAFSVSNGKGFNISLPDPDFVFDLDFKGAKVFPFGQAASGRSVIYGVLFNIQLNCTGDSPCLDNKNQPKNLNGDFKNGVVVKIPATQVDDGSGDVFAYDDAIRELFGRLALTIHSKSVNGPAEPSNWLAKATSLLNVETQFQQTNEVFQKCK